MCLFQMVRKSLRARGGGWLEGKSIFWTQLETHELTVVERALTILVQAQARPNPIMRMGGGSTLPPLAMSYCQLIAAQRGSDSSLVSQSHFGGRPQSKNM